MKGNDGDNDTSLTCCRTLKFSVLSVTGESDSFNHYLLPNPSNLPVLPLDPFLEADDPALSRSLYDALSQRGFCCLVTPKDSAAGRVLFQLQKCLEKHIFPNDENADRLPVSDDVYVSERGVPMYRLGYERSEDGVREFFRVCGQQPNEPSLPNSKAQAAWLRGLTLCRRVTDAALDRLLTVSGSAHHRKAREGAGQSRLGDYSVMYAMHYFNEAGTPLPEDGIALKQHVDPSLLVMEPFLHLKTQGLQVLDQTTKSWLDCDGPTSPAHGFPDHVVSLLFGGKALHQHVPAVEPALHRVVAGHSSRRAVVYEQKYEEFAPPPVLD